MASKVAKSPESLLTVMNRTLTKSDSCDASVTWRGEGRGERKRNEDISFEPA